MSEFTHKQLDYNKRLKEFSLNIFHANKPAETIRSNQDLINKVSYSNIIWLVDEFIRDGIKIDDLKTGVNKVLNVFFKPLNEADIEKPRKSGFLDFLAKNNVALDEKLKALKSDIKAINVDPNQLELIEQIVDRITEIQKFDRHYIIKENILFPYLEKYWDDFRCVKLMWSFHDDIRENIKKALRVLQHKTFDLKAFNGVVGDIFFNMMAIRFREEKLLFPKIIDTLDDNIQGQMLQESIQFPWPFITPDKSIEIVHNNSLIREGEIDLETGSLIPEQIKLMMNHLPVDVTYVDENNIVRYFSTPQKRIFPRSKAIIGRDVRNCHPHDSVHIVEKIVESFRLGKKSHADFWIKMKGEYILIQYFAIRNDEGDFKGTLEVSMEISGIKAIEGEKRLLDWNN